MKATYRYVGFTRPAYWRGRSLCGCWTVVIVYNVYGEVTEAVNWCPQCEATWTGPEQLKHNQAPSEAVRF